MGRKKIFKQIRKTKSGIRTLVKKSPRFEYLAVMLPIDYFDEKYSGIIQQLKDTVDGRLFKISESKRPWITRRLKIYFKTESALLAFKMIAYDQIWKMYRLVDKEFAE